MLGIIEIQEIGSIISIVRAVHAMCARAKACRSLLGIVERKMESLIPILEEVQNQSEMLDSMTILDALTSLRSEVQDTKHIVEKASKMSRIKFILTASDLRDKLENNLRSVHLSMTSLEIGQSSSIAAELKEFHTSWKAREAELQEETAKMESLRQRLTETLANPAESNKENIAKVAGIDISQVDELERELARARFERSQMQQDMFRCVPKYILHPHPIHSTYDQIELKPHVHYMYSCLF